MGVGSSQHEEGGTGRRRERRREAANGKDGSEVTRWKRRGEGNRAGRGGGATAGSGSGHESQTAWQQKAGPRGNPGSPEPFPANAEADEGLLQFRSY